MGFGTSLALIAIGAVLAFATHFTLSGINVQTIGWILIAVGVAGLALTLAYLRPRRRGMIAEIDGTEPAYDVRPGDEEPVIVPEPRNRWYARRPRTVRRTPHTAPAGGTPYADDTLDHENRSDRW